MLTPLPSARRTPSLLWIWGLCPDCDRWFPADEFYDESVPVPRCPACGLEPSRLFHDHGGLNPPEPRLR